MSANGTKRTFGEPVAMSASDPNRTYRAIFAWRHLAKALHP